MATHFSKTTQEQLYTSEDMCAERMIHPEHALKVRRNLLSTEEAASISELFSVLSDPTRLQVLNALLSAPTGELCVCDIAAGLRRDDTTISHQLRVLRNHKVVAMRKAGRVVYYRLIDEHIRQLLRMGSEHVHEFASSAPQEKAGVLA